MTTAASQPATAAAGGGVTRMALARALGIALLVLAVAGVAVGALLFGAEVLPRASASYYLVGLCAAGLAAMVTVYLHGRFADTPAPRGLAGGGVAPGNSFLVTGRLQSLLAAAFAVKVVVLVIGIVLLRQLPLPALFGAESMAAAAGGGDASSNSAPKFSDVATFAVTFAGAALLCQLATAFALSRALRNPTRDGSTPS